MASRYFLVDSAYDDTIKNIFRDSVDMFPFQGENGWWRNDPLSDESIIRPNRAGYYPYKQTFKENETNHRDVWDYGYSAVCSTRFPSNPQYKNNREIILYR
jgi:hypothetical protein